MFWIWRWLVSTYDFTFGRIIGDFSATIVLIISSFVASTHDQCVFSFYPEGRYCHGFEEALARYREIVPLLKLSGSSKISFLFMQSPFRLICILTCIRRMPMAAFLFLYCLLQVPWRSHIFKNFLLVYATSFCTSHPPEVHTYIPRTSLASFLFLYW